MLSCNARLQREPDGNAGGRRPERTQVHGDKELRCRVGLDTEGCRKTEAPIFSAEVRDSPGMSYSLFSSRGPVVSTSPCWKGSLPKPLHFLKIEKVCLHAYFSVPMQINPVPLFKESWNVRRRLTLFF
jgi:hypothetical protein